MEDEILILIDGRVNPIFIKANRLILSKYADQISKGKTHLEKIKIIEKMWNKEFKATLKKNLYWNTINFQSLKDLTLFSLKNG